MELTVCGGIISVSKNMLLIKCKGKEISTCFEELYKLVPRNVKVIDVKRILTDKMSILLS